jgi:hypothetical protein
MVEISLYCLSRGRTPAVTPSVTMTPSAAVPISNSNNTLWRTESFLARLGALLNLKMPDLFDNHKIISSRAPHFYLGREVFFAVARTTTKLGCHR